MTREIPEGFVKLEKAICLVCTKPFECGGILLHKNLREIPEEETITHWDLCPEHKKKYEEGFIALVEVDPKKSEFTSKGNMLPQGAYRTGRIMHMQKHIAKDMLSHDESVPLAFIEPVAFDLIVEWYEKQTGDKLGNNQG